MTLRKRSLFKGMEDLRRKYEDFDLSETECNKIKGDCHPGCQVEIHWVTEHGTKIMDRGYVFVLEGMDAEVGDCFVHVPYPNNPGGKDTAPGEWTYMIALQANQYCKKIVCK